MAGRYLGTQPLTTCFTLMGVGALVGALVTVLYQCCCRVGLIMECDVQKEEVYYEEVTEEKKNN